MKTTVSNSFIIISAIFTFVSFQNEDIFIYGMNHYFLEQGNYIELLIQIVFYSFLHGGIAHLVFNSIFLFIFGNKVESLLGKNNFIIFFLISTLFNAAFILLFSSENTIGISGFCMALLSFYTLKLHEIKDPEYKGGITAIIINILIGFSGSISLAGHLGGAIIGGIYYISNKIIKRS